ncbi:MAG: hypothetical protein ABIK65_11460 [Candidatus Eisenbacteria bacterium]
MKRIRVAPWALLAAAALLGCAAPPPTSREIDAMARRKIGFDLARFRGDGLYGPPDGARTLDYEFCVPKREDLLAEVKAIDPSLRVMPGVRGRAGCGEGALLCVGNTGQPGFRQVLLRLARLDYVDRIYATEWE